MGMKLSEKYSSQEYTLFHHGLTWSRSWMPIQQTLLPSEAIPSNLPQMERVTINGSRVGSIQNATRLSLRKIHRSSLSSAISTKMSFKKVGISMS